MISSVSVQMDNTNTRPCQTGSFLTSGIGPCLLTSWPSWM
jgi:hypothetical protein